MEDHFVPPAIPALIRRIQTTRIITVDWAVPFYFFVSDVSCLVSLKVKRKTKEIVIELLSPVPSLANCSKDKRLGELCSKIFKRELFIISSSVSPILEMRRLLQHGK